MSTILVIDDDIRAAEALSIMLELEEQYTVITALSGQEGLEKLKMERKAPAVDVILTDIKMKGMDGLEVLSAVKQLYPDLPVIMITAYASIDTAIKATKDGAYDYIEKPFDNEKLKIVIRNALREYQLTVETKQLKQELRLITATNQNILMAMQNGQFDERSEPRGRSFREDLFYRINVITIQMPPLRNRREDISFLAYHFLSKHNSTAKTSPQNGVERISPEAMKLLVDNEWPGNVRQLENVIQMALLTATGTEITPADLPPDINHQIAFCDDDYLSLANIEKRHILKILVQVDWKIYNAAEILKINPSTLYRKLKKIQTSQQELQ